MITFEAVCDATSGPWRIAIISKITGQIGIYGILDNQTSFWFDGLGHPLRFDTRSTAIAWVQRWFPDWNTRQAHFFMNVRNEKARP